MASDAHKFQTDAPRPPAEVPAGPIISADTHRANRIPPGQERTRKWPVLHAGRVPEIDLDTWQLRVFGLVENELEFSWESFNQLPQVQVYADFHCVTRWSRLDNVWQGVSVAEMLGRAGVKPEAKFVILHGYDDGWTTNLPLADFLVEDALLATLHDGEPLSADHGGPLRAIVPRLYAWKSAKWLCGIELAADDRPGYWERGGYHNHGDPWFVDEKNPGGERFQRYH